MSFGVRNSHHYSIFVHRTDTTHLVTGSSPSTLSPNTAVEPRFTNRDLSWLDFNDRVLHQALDEQLPLLERVKFCAICASNLDEFFMKRVGLLRQRQADPAMRDRRGPDGLVPAQTLAGIRERVTAHQSRLAACYREATFAQARRGRDPDRTDRGFNQISA